MSISPTEILSASQQHDHAYDSANFKGECNSSDLLPNHLPQSKGTTTRPGSTELHSNWPQDQASSVSSLTHFKKTLSKLDRRFSEPDMFSQGCQEDSMRSQKLTKSEESFAQQEELGRKDQRLRKQIVADVHLAGLYKNKKPPNLSIKNSLQSERSSSSLPRTSSGSSLDSSSSVSDSSVFTSSPLESPSGFKKNTLTQPQFFSSNPSDGGNDISSQRLKRNSVVTHKKVLTKSQSISAFQRDSFKKNLKKERHLSCRIVQGTYVNTYNPAPVACQQRSRVMSADEVFRLVDQRNPRKPPSYAEATQNCSAARLPSYGSLTVQNMRASAWHPASAIASEPQQSRLNREVMNKVYKDLSNDGLSTISDSKDKRPAVDLVIGIHTRANLPLTPQVYRLRTMSGSYQKNKQEYLTRRCSQPAFDHIQCAKESYV